jgi:hypothetical protein
MITRVIRLAAILVILVALTGCAVTVALAVPASASAPVTKTEGVAFARAVNLQAGDLPGATEPVMGSAHGAGCGRPSGKRSHPVVDEASVLSDHFWLVASGVRVMKTEALAEAEVSAFASRRGRVCLARELGEGVRVEGKTVRSVLIKVTVVPTAKALGPGAIGLHVLAKRPHTPKTAILYASGFVFRVGPAEIEFVRLGERPFPTATEWRLLGLLHSRAEAHKL